MKSEKKIREMLKEVNVFKKKVEPVDRDFYEGFEEALKWVLEND